MQEAAARLQAAAKDKRVKALVLAIDSPGGTVAASDALHHLVAEYKRKAGVPVVAALMGVAASGGYYAALAADQIVAWPSTVTGSIGTVFIRPEIDGLMDKVGVRAEVTKSGRLKDMASPFRAATEEERLLLQAMIDQFNARFLDLVRQSRPVTEADMKVAADARILTGQQALALHLVDGLGYLDEAIDRARLAARLPVAARVVVYRRNETPDDTPYNTAASEAPGPRSLVDLGLAGPFDPEANGFCHLWAPGWDPAD